MTVTVEYEAEEKLDLPYEEIIKNVIEESLDYVECPYDAEVNVLLTDNAGIHQINLDMRGIDNPTDVLSFPMCDFETPGDFSHLEDTPEEYFDPDTGELLMGDIVISVDKVKEQAEKYGVSTELFPDNGAIADWASDHVYAAKAAGLMKGDAGTGMFRPTSTITRAEAASILMNANRAGLIK